MTTYQGEATVIVNAVEYEVTADLRVETEHVGFIAGGMRQTVEGLRSWGGTLTVQGPDAAWSISDADMARLRLPDGREGEFLVSAGDFSTGPLVITGSGAAPF
ncbi:hypothetical protein [Streptomyces camponoticapitis]|nr:hypothetical protein [Streptomyces camponoticapitis]